ncbi:PLOD1 [Cordylochernes scorpioides]|uniref:PLOD1 n=1 Tax=Cordylochernes scorpioides TaxID=51811 RepID=A0ABY6KJL7_9ARAC|nr:PLOD1 [Cordylochernes scorpioides]
MQLLHIPGVRPLLRSINLEQLQVITVATSRTNGFQRFMRSAGIYSHNVEVLGLGQTWEGGDVRVTTGGGQKVNLLKDALEKVKDKDDLVVMFVDSYDVILLAPPTDILRKFLKMKARIVFSAEGFCWPDESLAGQYPKVEDGKPYLNSGGFLGYAPDIYQMVTNSDIANNDDDQLFYTKIYLDKKLRKKWSIKLDHKAEIFQNLNAAIGDVELRFKDDETILYNKAYGTEPLVVHGNGPTKVALNSIGNYLARAWSPTYGCLACAEDRISLERLMVEEMPRVVLGVFIERPTPFLPEFLQHILDLDYPKERMDLFLHNNAKHHDKDVDQFIKSHHHKFNSHRYISADEAITEWRARNLGLEECQKHKCDYYFTVDAGAQLTNPLTLRLLMEQNRSVIAPLIVRANHLWSNFWGALSSEGFYARSSDYVDIVKTQKR